MSICKSFARLMSGARWWVVAVSVILTACSASSAQPARTPGPSDVIATVGSSSITLTQVDERAMEQPAGNFGSMKLSAALYEARRAALEELIGNSLIEQEAKARGVDRAALTEQEITPKITPVSDADVAAWYQANQGRVQGASLDQVRSPIRAMLVQERTQGARRDFIDRLKAKTPVRVLLDPPRQTVKMVSTSPTRGKADAPIQIVEFSDFQ